MTTQATAALAATLLIGVVATKPAEATPASPPKKGEIAYMGENVKNPSPGVLDLEIFTVDADGKGKPKQVTDFAENNLGGFALSPDGSRIAYVAPDAESHLELFVRPFGRKGTPTQLTDISYGVNDPDYAPDGKRIAFFAYDNEGDWEIYTVPADGSASPIQLTENTTDDTWPGYSPNSSTIVYTGKDAEGDQEIFTIGATPSGGTLPTPVKVTDSPLLEEFGPDYSPDGSAIAFYGRDLSSADDDYEIYTMPAGGGTPTQLTHNTRPDGWPDYSPDGSTIAYTGSETESPYEYEIYTVPAGGGTPTQLTQNTTYDVFPKWVPPKKGA